MNENSIQGWSPMPVGWIQSHDPTCDYKLDGAHCTAWKQEGK